ncbi:phage tail protein [Providencia rettgeri]|jgi:phage protein U|uniref:phage tail protein n=1 Tax=Providencia TaxID=586 RepID=UPI001C5B4BE3|nr:MULTISPECIES: phage tail protein [Providencia]MDH2395600.1 phage tail protein [Providencia rettgeri]MDR2241321.1 phage tail protein [Providencia alcalifaciens]QXX84628.1 phage tail protein [Providencia sp. R33]HEC8329208.1 phage tail protein [Providencia rettgeri]
MAMAALGLFVFQLNTTPYQMMQINQKYRYGVNNRVGKRPAVQFIGLDNDDITLSGTLLPSLTGGRLSLLVLEQMAETGRAWSLIDGTGNIYGMYVIEEITQSKSEFFVDGAPRKIDFTLKLKRTDESLSEMLGDLNQQLNDIRGALPL